MTDRNSVFLTKTLSKEKEQPQNVDALAFLVNNFDKQGDGMSYGDPTKAFPNYSNTGNTPHFVPQTSNVTTVSNNNIPPGLSGY